MRSTSVSSSRKPRGPPPSWCQPSRSSSPPKAVSQPASCARSRQLPSPYVSPPICHKVSNGQFPHLQKTHIREHQSNVPGNNILVLPADLVAEAANSAVLAAGLQSEDTQSLGNNHLLLLVVRGRDTLEDLKSLESGGTAGGLVGDHATDGLVKDAGRGAEVEGTCIKSDLAIEDIGMGSSETHHRGWGCTGSSCGGRRGT